MLVLNRDQFIDVVVSRNLYDEINLVWNFNYRLYFEGYMDTEEYPEKVIINQTRPDDSIENNLFLDPKKTVSEAVDSFMGTNPKTYTFENNCNNYLINRNSDIRKQYMFSEFINCEYISSEGVHKVDYDKIIIFSAYVDGASSVENAKDKEIIFLIAPNDGNYSQIKSALNNMKSSGYKNVTMVSNGNDLSSYENTFLVIKPGNLMKNGHLSENVLSSGIIEYAND